MAKIDGEYIGELVHGAQGDHLLYRDNQAKRMTFVKPYTSVSGEVDHRLLHLRTVRRRHSPIEQHVRWEAGSESVRAALKERFGIESPPPRVRSDIEDPRHAVMLGSASRFVWAFNRVQTVRGARPFTDDEEAQVHQYVKQIITTTGSSQSEILIAAQYLERLPQETWQELALQELIAGCLMVAKTYSGDEKYDLSSWRDVTGLSEERLGKAKSSIFYGLDYDASAGEIRTSTSAPSSVYTNAAAGRERRFSAKGAVTVDKATDAEIAQLNAEDEAARLAERPVSPPMPPQSASAAGTSRRSPSPAMPQVRIKETAGFERALLALRNIPPEAFKKMLPDLIAAVDGLAPERRQALLQAILRKCVMAHHYPAPLIFAALDKLTELASDYPQFVRRDQINTLALMLEANMDMSEQDEAVVVDKLGSLGAETFILDFIRELDPAEDTADIDLLANIIRFGRFLGVEPDALQSFNDVLTSASSDEPTRLDAVTNMKARLLQAAQSHLSPYAVSEVRDVIAEQADELHTSVSRAAISE